MHCKNHSQSLIYCAFKFFSQKTNFSKGSWWTSHTSKMKIDTKHHHTASSKMSVVVDYIFYPSTLKQFHGKIFQSFQSTWQGSGTYTTTKVVSTWIRSQALPKHLWRTNARRTLPAASFPSRAELHRTGSIYNTHVIVIFDMLRV